MSTEPPPTTIVVEPLATPTERRIARDGAGVGLIEELGLRATDAPDLIEPIVGFRNWRIFRGGSTRGELSSPYLPVSWTEPVLRAECRRQRTVDEIAQRPHDAPAAGCGCGISAYHEPTGSFSQTDFRAVSGIVTVWGRIELDRGGMRAQIARVEALAVYERWSRHQRQAVREVADELGVDLVDLPELGAAAKGYGETLPRSLLEEDPPRRVRDRFAALFTSRVSG